MTKLLTFAFVTFLATACSSNSNQVDLGLGGLPGDKASASPNGVTQYTCDEMNVAGKQFTFTLDAGSPSTKVFSEKICSCLRAGKAEKHANKLAEKVMNNGQNSFDALAQSARLGKDIKKCEAAVI